MGSEVKHAFVSYVAEDKLRVDKLCGVLDAAGVPYWRDRKALGPGDDWKSKIREAIGSGALVFLACFSDHSRAKTKTYMNEELALAVDEYRLRAPGQKWLIPVRFDKGDVPDWNLGAGRTLRDLNHVDLFGKAHTENALQLVEAIKAVMGVPSVKQGTVRAALEQASKEPATRTGRRRKEEVSKEHRSQLRGAAHEWANEFSSLLDPDWAVRKPRLDVIDSDDGLIALRAHFPQLSTDYSKWRAMNISLRGVDTELYWMAGRSGQMPTTNEGKRALKDHNDLVRTIVAELGKIEVQTRITGRCDQCESS